ARHCLFYLDRDKDLGEVSKGRWRVLRRLLGVFVDYVNEAMREPWSAGDYRNVVLLDHARAGHCIAREEPHASELPRVILGRATITVEPTEQQLAALSLRRREAGITRLVNGGRLQGATRSCPECNYPVPGSGKSCYVCGFELGRE
ncbi:MAG: hypothetical protein R3B70_27760, partial [Polyangiaceae bacterium]